MASRFKTSIPALFLLGLGVLASACGAASAQQTKVRFASVGGITDAPLYLAEEFGLFKEAGLSVEMMRMASATSLMTAVATNQLDAAGISITPGLYSSVKQGMNMRIVGDKQSLRPGFSATRLLIRADLSQGNEAADMKALKGKKIAFTTKAIDAAIDLEPFMSQALQAGAAKVTSDLTEFVPPAGATIVPIVYSEDFVARAPAAKAFMKAYMQGVRIYNDAFTKGRDKEKIIEIIARYAKVKPEIVSEGFPAGLDPDQTVSASFLDELQDFFIEQKFLREKIDVRRIVDTSFADAAVHDLGTYK
jgi:NitT/TauT family transport system substrate-binding protein